MTTCPKCGAKINHKNGAGCMFDCSTFEASTGAINEGKICLRRQLAAMTARAEAAEAKLLEASRLAQDSAREAMTLTGDPGWQPIETAPKDGTNYEMKLMWRPLPSPPTTTSAAKAGEGEGHD